jgi:hypothetical protein
MVQVPIMLERVLEHSLIIDIMLLKPRCIMLVKACVWAKRS